MYASALVLTPIIRYIGYRVPEGGHAWPGRRRRLPRAHQLCRTYPASSASFLCSLPPTGRVRLHKVPQLSLTPPSLADAAACKRDIPNLQKLTVNAVRVYSVDAALNHDDCMSQLSAAGIYTMFVSELFHLFLAD